MALLLPFTLPASFGAPVPLHRTMVVVAEVRVMRVPAEVRVVRVPAEVRVVRVRPSGG